MDGGRTDGMGLDFDHSGHGPDRLRLRAPAAGRWMLCGRGRRPPTMVRLNWPGRATMNSLAPSLGQRYAGSLLERLGGRIEGGRVLEVGCGGGAGVKIILERFGAAEVVAFDLDPMMIERARRQLSGFGGARVQ